MAGARGWLVAGGLALAMTGCMGAPTMYHWNGYDAGLYGYYRNPQDREAWVERLRTTIDGAQVVGKKVPPGLRAEYGFALYEEGVYAEAIAQFRKEAEEWPESRFLMDKMIRNAERRGATKPDAPPTTGPAGALERKP